MGNAWVWGRRGCVVIAGLAFSASLASTAPLHALAQEGTAPSVETVEVFVSNEASVGGGTIDAHAGDAAPDEAADPSVGGAAEPTVPEASMSSDVIPGPSEPSQPEPSDGADVPSDGATPDGGSTLDESTAPGGSAAPDEGAVPDESTMLDGTAAPDDATVSDNAAAPDSMVVPGGDIPSAGGPLPDGDAASGDDAAPDVEGGVADSHAGDSAELGMPDDGAAAGGLATTPDPEAGEPGSEKASQTPAEDSALADGSDPDREGPLSSDPSSSDTADSAGSPTPAGSNADKDPSAPQLEGPAGNGEASDAHGDKEPDGLGAESAVSKDPTAVGMGAPAQTSPSAAGDGAADAADGTGAPAEPAASVTQPDSGARVEAAPAAAPQKKSGWQTIDGNRFYYGKDGKPLTGEQKIGGSWYYLDPDRGGAIRTGLVTQPIASGSGSFKTAYYDADGKRLSGLQKVSGSTYYFDTVTGARTSGFVYLKGPGKGAGTFKFFDAASGTMLTGEQVLNDEIRYFDPKTGTMETGITTLPATQSHDSFKVYLDQYDGTVGHGAIDVNGSSYYFSESDGRMETDTWKWLDGGSRIVYYKSDGTQARGTTWIGGEHYWFDTANGSSSYAQLLRWQLSHAPSSTSAQFFNGGSAAGWALNDLAQAAGAFAAQGLHAGYVMMDIRTGKGVACNADGVYYSASTVKAPYVASVYDKVFLSNTNNSSPWYGTLSDICVWSDNDAYFAFRNTYGNDVFARWLYESGVDTSRADTKYTWFTPRDLAKMWLRMYDYFGYGGAAGQQLSGLLSHGYYSSIYNELGTEYQVSSKAGWYPYDPGYTATNDAGIVYAGDNPYLVVVLSDAPVRLDLTQALVRALDNVHKTMVP